MSADNGGIPAAAPVNSHEPPSRRLKWVILMESRLFGCFLWHPRVFQQQLQSATSRPTRQASPQPLENIPDQTEGSIWHLQPSSFAGQEPSGDVAEMKEGRRGAGTLYHRKKINPPPPSPNNIQSVKKKKQGIKFKRSQSLFFTLLLVRQTSEDTYFAKSTFEQFSIANTGLSTTPPPV